jgi:hypothetical protein
MTLCPVGLNLQRELVETGTSWAQARWRAHVHRCDVCGALRPVEPEVRVYRVISKRALGDGRTLFVVE